MCYDMNCFNTYIRWLWKFSINNTNNNITCYYFASYNSIYITSMH